MARAFDSQYSMGNNRVYDFGEDYKMNTLEIRQKSKKYKYLVCIWCGSDLSLDIKEGQYCAKKCKDEAQGVNLTS